jgi:hypothetical protein
MLLTPPPTENAKLHQAKYAGLSHVPTLPTRAGNLPGGRVGEVSVEAVSRRVHRF